jgi:eukaryotic-like serine/threonine-protein kinase
VNAPQGPLPVETALNYARQVADALEAAHEKGIVHRDLKPANIRITPEAVVKVLDFGLAVVAPGPAGESNPANSPTLTMGATQKGTIMGTATYMSPEQASGKPADKRADIWSFGVVLWELLTGRQLFQGETVSHTLADVLRGPIDFDKLPAATPPAIQGLLERCLDRDLKTRLRDIGEARILIQKYQANPASVAAPGLAPANPASVSCHGWSRPSRSPARPDSPGCKRGPCPELSLEPPPSGRRTAVSSASRSPASPAS